MRGYDLVLTSFPHFVERFRALGVRSEYLRLAFHPAVLDRLQAPDRRRPLTFVGSVDPRVHGEGAALLERVAGELPLEAFGYGAEQLAPGSALAVAHGGEAWGLDMYRLLAESRVTLNRHIAAAEGNANNMRLYEATGVGALLLTEDAPNLRDVFEPGEEVVAYTSADDLVEKARHYLEHEDERASHRRRRPGAHAARAQLRAADAASWRACSRPRARRRSARRSSPCRPGRGRARACRASAAAAPCGPRRRSARRPGRATRGSGSGATRRRPRARAASPTTSSRT